MFVATQLLTAHNDKKLRCCASSFVELLKVTILKIFRKSNTLYFICKADLPIFIYKKGRVAKWNIHSGLYGRGKLFRENFV